MVVGFLASELARDILLFCPPQLVSGDYRLSEVWISLAYKFCLTDADRVTLP